MSRSNSEVYKIINNITAEEEFYKKTFYFSYSSLQKLLFSPSLWHSHYILNIREDKLDNHLVNGSVIHNLLLDDGTFDKNFIVSPANIPVGNNKLVVDRLFYGSQSSLHPDLSGFTTEILDILKHINLHQSAVDDKPTKAVPVGKTGDQKRLDKIITEENSNYYQFLKKKGERTIIDEETLNECKMSVSILQSNKRVRELLHMDHVIQDNPNIEVCNECDIKIEPDKYKFGFKGIIDNHIIDKLNKTVYINDLKTSGKSLSEFSESIEFYKYYLQAAIYTTMISKKHSLDDTWTIVFNFIVIDKYHQVYCFEVSNKTMSEWIGKLNEALEIADYHYSNIQYTLPYAFCTGKVML